MQQSEEKHIIVGKIGSTYGVKGWVKVISFTEIALDILNFSPWYLESPTGWEKIKVEDGRPHGKAIVVKLPGYNAPEQARLLTGKKIAVTQSQLPALEKGEYYWSDLEGLSVINQHNEVLGKVIYLINTGANDVLVVKGDKEHAIPYLPGTVILKIDLEKKEIHVDWELI